MKPDCPRLHFCFFGAVLIGICGPMTAQSLHHNRAARHVGAQDYVSRTEYSRVVHELARLRRVNLRIARQLARMRQANRFAALHRAVEVAATQRAMAALREEENAERRDLKRLQSQEKSGDSK